jgi:hypothetical protein
VYKEQLILSRLQRKVQRFPEGLRTATDDENDARVAWAYQIVQFASLMQVTPHTVIHRSWTRFLS